MKSLRRILIFRYTLLLAAVLAAIALLVIIPIRSFTLSQEKENLEDEAKFLAAESHRLFTEDISSQETIVFIAELGSGKAYRLMLIDTDGNILGDLAFPVLASEDLLGRPEVASALEGHVSSDIRESLALDGRSFIFAAAPVIIDGEIWGVACTALAVESVTPVMLRIWLIILIAFGVLLVVIIAVSVWTERTIFRDLRAVRDAASGLAGGDLSRRVAEPGIKDFAVLARDFNAMAEQVRLQIEEAAAERGKLEAVLNNISTGVMVTDSESRIVLLNQAAEMILGVEREQAAGHRTIEVFSSKDLDLAVSRAAGGESVEEEIDLIYPQGMSLHLKSDPVYGADGQIVASVSAIEDITALKRLNQIRQDFVANVSHELRTPVATIRALTDSLLGGGVEDRERAERFLLDLDREVSRLSQLIEDLLALSRLEAKGAALQVEEYYIAELVRECLDSKGKLAEEYGVRLRMEPIEEDLAIKGDRQLLRTALGNLFDNAIKYNHSEGEVIVRIRTVQGGDGVNIEIEDTGIGMPRDELPRVFERFYRIDKARSRETGGTGLGLSIVKHIAELHGGTVTVASMEGEGSTFSLTIPVG